MRFAGPNDPARCTRCRCELQIRLRPAGRLITSWSTCTSCSAVHYWTGGQWLPVPAETLAAARRDFTREQLLLLAQ